MTTTIQDTCTECGEPLEASITVYLDRCEFVEEDGKIVLVGDNKSDGIGVEVKGVYCSICDQEQDYPGEGRLDRVRFDGKEYLP